MERKLLDIILLYTGCYWLSTVLVTTILITLGGLLSNSSLYEIIIFWLLAEFFIVVSIIYFRKIAPEIRKEYFNNLEKKGIAAAKIDCPNLQKFIITKPTQRCPNHHKDFSGMEYSVTYFYLCDDFFTIYTNCVKFHIFNISGSTAKNMAKKKAVAKYIKKYIQKEDCGEILEYYYFYVQHVEFVKDSIIFYFSDGSTKSFKADKSNASKIIKVIREHLRTTAQRKMFHGFKKEPFHVTLDKSEKS